MSRPIDADKLLDDITAAKECGGMGAIVAGTLRRYVMRQPTLTQPNEWVSVEERLPAPKQNVLAYSPKSGIAEADYADGVLMQYRWSAVMDGVTHWMPLPAPPERQENTDA